MPFNLKFHFLMTFVKMSFVLKTLETFVSMSNVVPGNTKGGNITVQLTSCLTCLDLSISQIKTKIVSCQTADSKPVKQEINSTVILPPLVYPGCTDTFSYDISSNDICPKDICPKDICPKDICPKDICPKDICPKDI
jgi:hypothetical protein